jgi:hypothetical protein
MLSPLFTAGLPSQLNCQLSTHFECLNHLPTANSRTLNPVLYCICQLSRCHLFSIISDCRFSANSQLAWDPYNVASGQTQQKALFANNPFIVACMFVAAGTCLMSRCLAINVYPGSTISAFRHHVIL